MLFGIIIVPSVNAEDIKILTTKTLKVGQSADVALTDPDTGKKLQTIWESTNPSVATVTSDGKVTGKKAGECTVYTYYNSKYYGVKVTVINAAEKKTSDKTSAYTKLANYLEKNGTKTTAYGGTDYIINWKEDGYLLWLCFRVNVGISIVITIPKANSKDCYTDFSEGVYLELKKSGKKALSYWKQSNSWTYYNKECKKGTTVNTAKLKLKHKSGPKFSKANSRARKLSKAGMSLWTKFLKARVGITVKKLGFIYKTGSSAKKISISQKSATLKKGKTLKLKLKNAKASKVKWSSSKKNVATVSKKGVVKAKKKGKATITAKYKGKKYKCKITVKKGGMTVSQAVNKLISYLKKSDPHTPVANGDYWAVNWTKNDFKYSLMYDNDKSDFVFIGNYKGSLIIELHFSAKKDYTCYYTKLTDDGAVEYKMSLNQAKKSLKLDSITDFKQVSGSTAYNTANLNAKATLEWMFPEFNSYISKKAGVTMKNLGFKKWK